MSNKLYSCPDCKNLVSTKAAMCPHCGRPFRKSSYGCLIVLILLMIAGFVGLGTCGPMLLSFSQELEKLGPKEKSFRTNHESEIRRETYGRASKNLMSHIQLFREYRQNEIRADAKYKGGPVCVRATIADIGKEIMGTPYIYFAVSSSQVGGVQFVFDDPEFQSPLASLSAGEVVTVCGMCSGLMMNVLMRNAMVVP